MDSFTDMPVLTELLRCPATGQELREEGGRLVTEDGRRAYRTEDGIPVLLAEEAEEQP